MTIGTITSSQQDFVKAEVRVEDGSSLETYTGGTSSSTPITTSIGQEFTATAWFSRIKVVIANGGSNTLMFSLYESHSKATLHHSVLIEGAGINSVAHLAFDSLPPGVYYWELTVNSGSGTTYISSLTGSTIQTAYVDAMLDTSIDFKSKIMYTGGLVERDIAIDGDSVDTSVTTVLSGESIMGIQVGTVVENVSYAGDALANGGEVLTGAWFMEGEL